MFFSKLIEYSRYSSAVDHIGMGMRPCWPQGGLTPEAWQFYQDITRGFPSLQMKPINQWIVTYSNPAIFSMKPWLISLGPVDFRAPFNFGWSWWTCRRGDEISILMLLFSRKQHQFSLYVYTKCVGIQSGYGGFLRWWYPKPLLCQLIKTHINKSVGSWGSSSL